jgi:hypothetical protein
MKIYMIHFGNLPLVACSMSLKGGFILKMVGSEGAISKTISYPCAIPFWSKFPNSQSRSNFSIHKPGNLEPETVAFFGL